VKENGAHHILDHTQGNTAEQVKSLTGGAGANVILEMLANKNLVQDLLMVALHGRIVIIGNRGNIEINPRDAMWREAVIVGMALWNATERELSEVHAALVAALASGVARPVIGKELPLGEASRAHGEILEPGSYGKIVLIP